jgi:hypothetical protein
VLISECATSLNAFRGNFASYRTDLAAYERRLTGAQERASAATTARTYVHSGNGLVGGATWSGGYYASQDATPEVRERAMERFREQARAAGIDPAGIDMARYNFILGIAAAPELEWDLYRLFQDQRNEGRFSARQREAYASLRGREFDELGCHSNGAMICLEALHRGDARADDVVLYGPQLTEQSLDLWQQLAADGRIQSLRIYVNENDPVPPGTIILSPSASVSIRSRPILFDGAALRRTIHEAAPRAEVFTFACGSELTLNCHDMSQYTARRGCLRPQAPGEVEGTLYRGRRVREPPSPVCPH